MKLEMTYFCPFINHITAHFSFITKRRQLHFLQQGRGRGLDECCGCHCYIPMLLPKWEAVKVLPLCGITQQVQMKYEMKDPRPPNIQNRTRQHYVVTAVLGYLLSQTTQSQLGRCPKSLTLIPARKIVFHWVIYFLCWFILRSLCFKETS